MNEKQVSLDLFISTLIASRLGLLSIIYTNSIASDC